MTRELPIHRAVNFGGFPTALCKRGGLGHSMQALMTWKSAEVTCKKCLPIIARIQARKARH